jgi:hypothetical protein
VAEEALGLGGLHIARRLRWQEETSNFVQFGGVLKCKASLRLMLGRLQEAAQAAAFIQDYQAD